MKISAKTFASFELVIIYSVNTFWNRQGKGDVMLRSLRSILFFFSFVIEMELNNCQRSIGQTACVSKTLSKMSKKKNKIFSVNVNIFFFVFYIRKFSFALRENDLKKNSKNMSQNSREVCLCLCVCACVCIPIYVYIVCGYANGCICRHRCVNDKFN